MEKGCVTTGTTQSPGARTLRKEHELSAEERRTLMRARARLSVYRSHYDCVAEYLRYSDLLVEMGLKPAGYQPSINQIQADLGISCWRTVKRCVDKAREEGGEAAA